MSSLLSEGVDRDRISLIRRLDMRYQGQEHTLTVTLPNHASSAANRRLAALRRCFEDIYRARYGHSNPDASLETVNLRLTALGDVGRPLLQPGYRPTHPSDSPSQTTPVLFATGSYPTARFHRESLMPRSAIAGPAIVEEATATTVIPPEASATIDEYGCLIIKAPPL